MSDAITLDGPKAVTNKPETAGRSTSPSLSETLAYSASSLPTAFLYSPLWVIIPAMYVTYFGLELTAVAAVIFYSRFFDGVSDITIGYMSDLHRMAGGSRKTWVMVGGLGMAVASYFLLIPPEDVTVAYYAIWSLAFFLMYTVVVVPHLTWGAELTLDYNRRAKVYTVNYMFWGAGGSLFYIMPLLPIYETTEFTPEVIKDTAMVGTVLMLCFLVWTYRYAPKGLLIETEKKDSPALLLRTIIQNKPLLMLLMAYCSFALSMGMWFGLLYIYLDAYLLRGELLALSLLLGGLASVACLPVWRLIIEKTSKTTTWGGSTLLFCASLISFGVLEQDDPSWMGGVLISIGLIAMTCSNTCSASILGDIIDYGKLKFKQDRGGTYFATLNLVFKVGLGIGGGLALALAGWYAFDPNNTTHSASSIFGLKLGFIYIPIAWALLSSVLTFLIPITPSRHAIIRRRLASRVQSAGTSS